MGIKTYIILPGILVLNIFLLACTPPSGVPVAERPAASTLRQTEAPALSIEANLVDGCVEDYDPNIDYFPDKVSLNYATGWTVDYFNNYKVITILNPWREAEDTFQYVLVQCGTPRPDGYDEAQLVEVPARSIVTLSTTYLSHLEKLDLLDVLVGLDNFTYVNTPAVRQMIEAGSLVEVGSGANINIEMVLELNPDLVMTYGSGSPEFDAHPKLIEAGLNVPLNSEYMETSPLGRAEWLKFTAMFFNREVMAEEAFNQIAARYEALAVQAGEVENKPTVFTGTVFGGAWAVPGGNSFPAKYLADAGADYLWAEDDSTGSLILNFETVYEQAAEADFWLNTSTWSSVKEAVDADERYVYFAALRGHRTYNNNARLNENGGNDYWESGMINPDVILADLIKIFHPELMPNHDLVYYQQLE